jgi:hypothetical protein
VLVCTHATFRFAVDRFGVEAFDDRLIAVDEFHHVSANPDNKLGSQLGAFIARDKVHLVAMTGSYFRGDSEAVDVARYSDIRAVDPNGLAGVDILCGGFPCQDLSVAGKRAGLVGERSGLFWEIVRFADVLRPRWLVLENVPGLLSSNGGGDMATVIGALADLGYLGAWRVLDAQFVVIDEYGPIPKDDIAAGYDACLKSLPRLGFDRTFHEDGIGVWERVRPPELVPEAPLHCSGQHP